MSKRYMIPVFYEMYGRVPIEADSPEEAVRIAQETIADLPLPDDPSYVEETYRIDMEGEVYEVIREEQPAYRESKTEYRITYDIYDTWGTLIKNQHTVFTGTMKDLQFEIRQMKRCGYTNIRVESAKGVSK